MFIVKANGYEHCIYMWNFSPCNIRILQHAYKILENNNEFLKTVKQSIIIESINYDWKS